MRNWWLVGNTPCVEWREVGSSWKSKRDGTDMVWGICIGPFPGGLVVVLVALLRGGAWEKEALGSVASRTWPRTGPASVPPHSPPATWGAG